jgi:RHS repeat-associated protein
VTDSYFYTGYGKSVASSGSTANPFRYGGSVGYYTDGSLGLMLAGARWYSASAHRWLNRDPIEYKGGSNLYGYVSNNPVRFIDPSGHDPVTVVVVVAGIVVYELSNPTPIDQPWGPGDEVVHVAGGVASVVGAAGVANGVSAFRKFHCYCKPRGNRPNFIPPTNPPQNPPEIVPPGWRVRTGRPDGDYPRGYWKLEKPMKNGGWQPIDPSTMKPGVGREDTHIEFPTDPCDEE